MTRRVWMGLLVGLSACRAQKPVLDVLTETIGSGWHRTALRNVNPAEAPDPVPRDAIRQIQTATYEGPGKLEVHLYEVSSPAIALDLVQRWRPSENSAYFFFDHVYFVAISWKQTDRTALQAFVRELENRLNRPVN